MGNLMISDYYPYCLGEVNKVYCGSTQCWPRLPKFVTFVFKLYGKVHRTKTAIVDMSTKTTLVVDDDILIDIHPNGVGDIDCETITNDIISVVSSNCNISKDVACDKAVVTLRDHLFTTNTTNLVITYNIVSKNIARYYFKDIAAIGKKGYGELIWPDYSYDGEPVYIYKYQEIVDLKVTDHAWITYSADTNWKLVIHIDDYFGFCNIAESIDRTYGDWRAEEEHWVHFGDQVSVQIRTPGNYQAWAVQPDYHCPITFKVVTESGNVLANEVRQLRYNNYYTLDYPDFDIKVIDWKAYFQSNVYEPIDCIVHSYDGSASSDYKSVNLSSNPYDTRNSYEITWVVREIQDPVPPISQLHFKDYATGFENPRCSDVIDLNNRKSEYHIGTAYSINLNGDIASIYEYGNLLTNVTLLNDKQYDIIRYGYNNSGKSITDVLEHGADGSALKLYVKYDNNEPIHIYTLENYKRYITNGISKDIETSFGTVKLYNEKNIFYLEMTSFKNLYKSSLKASVPAISMDLDDKSLTLNITKRSILEFYKDFTDRSVSFRYRNRFENNYELVTYTSRSLSDLIQKKNVSYYKPRETAATFNIYMNGCNSTSGQLSFRAFNYDEYGLKPSINSPDYLTDRELGSDFVSTNINLTNVLNENVELYVDVIRSKYTWSDLYNEMPDIQFNVTVVDRATGTKYLNNEKLKISDYIPAISQNKIWTVDRNYKTFEMIFTRVGQGQISKDTCAYWNLYMNGQHINGALDSAAEVRDICIANNGIYNIYEIVD